MPRPKLLLMVSASEPRSEKVVSLQQARLKRTEQRAYREANGQRDRVAEMHGSLSRGFEAAGNSDQFARLQSMLEGDPGRQATDFLRECEKVQRANVGLLMTIGETIAENFRNYASNLLHVALSLVARPSLQRGDTQCLSTTTRTAKQQSAESFRDGAA